jgi:hypothetical protein
MKPLLSRTTPSFDVFKTKFDAWCFEKKIGTDDILKVLPSCIDDDILEGVVHIFSLGTTTAKSALQVLKDEYLRQTRPHDPDVDFNSLRTPLPSAAIESCARLQRMASYMSLGDTAVRHRLFNSLPTSLQPSVVAWLAANDKSTSRELANFITTFPDSVVQSQSSHTATVQEEATTPIAATTSRPVCSHCRKPGHVRDNCYKLRQCWNCKEPGHIAKNCQKQKNA